MAKNLSIAVVIPCYNEEITIEKVVRDFKSVLPDAVIYVCDNNSTDKTAEKAKSAGAVVIHEIRQGKAHAVRRLFREVEADYYIMVDGDDTYDARIAPNMLKLAIDNNYDLVNCVRNEVSENSNAYPAGHKFGMQLFGFIGLVFFVISLALGIPVVLEYFQTGLVRRFPTAFLSMGIMLLSFFSIATGIILDTVTRGKKEMRMLAYLQIGITKDERGY